MPHFRIGIDNRKPFGQFNRRLVIEPIFFSGDVYVVAHLTLVDNTSPQQHYACPPSLRLRRDTFRRAGFREPAFALRAAARHISSLTRRNVVPPEGLEPPHPQRQQILSLPRLPFRHGGTREKMNGGAGS